MFVSRISLKIMTTARIPRLVSALTINKEIKPLLQIRRLHLNNNVKNLSDQSNQREMKPMVVFLLGWTACEEKNLKNYSDFYQRKGLSVIKYCPPATLVFGINPKKQLLGHYPYLMEQLYAKNLDKLPILFHNFSNGGVYMYYTMLKQIKKDGLKGLRMAGSVFDSSPSPTYWTTVSGAAQSVIPGNKMVKFATGSVFAANMLFLVVINQVRAKLKGMDSDIERYRYYVAEELAKFPNQGPQHFLYSKIDSIIPDYGVEWFMEQRRKRGVQVSSTKWHDSTHVKHIVKYPQQYMSSLEAFLLFCQHRSFSLCDDKVVVGLECQSKELLLHNLKF